MRYRIEHNGHRYRVRERVNILGIPFWRTVRIPPEFRFQGECEGLINYLVSERKWTPVTEVVYE